MIARFTVLGIPAPQGSKTPMLLGQWITLPDGRRALVNPRSILVEGRNQKRKDGTNSDGRERHLAWRRKVAAAARRWKLENAGDSGLFDGPVTLVVWFYLPRPASLSPRVRWPVKKPDLSKLLRAVEDSLTSNVIVDDSQIVTSFIHKRYTTSGLGDLAGPRAEIVIEELEPYALTLVSA